MQYTRDWGRGEPHSVPVSKQAGVTFSWTKLQFPLVSIMQNKAILCVDALKSNVEFGYITFLLH